MNRRIIVSNLGGPEVLRLIEEPKPRPGAGQVLARCSSEYWQPGSRMLTS